MARNTGGTVTAPPITAPRPSVAPLRNPWRVVDGPSRRRTAEADGPGLGGAGGGAGRRRRWPDSSYSHRKPKTSVTPPPMATTHQLMIRPTRTQATPAATPTGQTLWLGAELCSPCFGSTLLPPPPPLTRRIQPPFASACQRCNR